MSFTDENFDSEARKVVNGDPKPTTTNKKKQSGVLTRTGTGLEFVYPYTTSALTAAIQFVLIPIWAGLRDGNDLTSWWKTLFALESLKIITASIHGLARLGVKGETPLADGLGVAASSAALVGILRALGHNTLGNKDAPNAFQFTFALITLPTVLKALTSLRNTVVAPVRIYNEVDKKRKPEQAHHETPVQKKIKAISEAANNMMAATSATYTSAWSTICLVAVISGLQHGVEKALTAAEYAGLVAGILTTVGMPTSLVVKAAAEIVSRWSFFNKPIPENKRNEGISLLDENDSPNVTPDDGSEHSVEVSEFN